MFDFKV